MFFKSIFYQKAYLQIKSYIFHIILKIINLEMNSDYFHYLSVIVIINSHI